MGPVAEITGTILTSKMKKRKLLMREREVWKSLRRTMCPRGINREVWGEKGISILSNAFQILLLIL